MTIAAIVLGMMAVSAFAPSLAIAKGPPAKYTDFEKAFIDAIDDEYAFEVTETLTYGGRVVTGTEKALDTARWIESQMIDECGLAPENVWIEDFPVVSVRLDETTAGDSIGYTSLNVLEGTQWVDIPAVQCHKGDGTGPEGIEAEIVDVGEGKLNDFRKLGEDGVKGKIVLFSRTDLMFYCNPVLYQAANLGAIGAICHFPIVPDDALKIDVSDAVLPMVYISNNDAADIRGLLAEGPVTARLIVDNDWTEEPVLSGHNVIGVIRGAEHPDEFVYLGAHFDHWFTSAADDNSGVGSLLAIAKAITESGLKPSRSIVFAAFDAEEMGGWADTWYDWTIGSFSHIVQTLDGSVLNPDLPGRIVAMFNMDVIATKNTIVYIESTPDVTKFVRKAAFDSGLLDLGVQTYIYWPPSSFDDWPFYMAGVPCTEIFWWGPEYDRVYHTTADTVETIDPLYLHVNIVFNGLLAIRMSEADVLPYDLPENIEAIQLGVDVMYALDPAAATETDLSVLTMGLESYTAEVEELTALVESGRYDADLVNSKMMEAAVALNPIMFDWDLTSWIPGWTGVSIFDNPANDLSCMKSAVAALATGDGEAALDSLADVATMRWGRFVDYDTYYDVLGHIYYVQDDHLLWGAGFLPPISDVHREYYSIINKLADGVTDFSDEISAIVQKVAALYANIDVLADELGSALLDAAAILSEASWTGHGKG